MMNQEKHKRFAMLFLILVILPVPFWTLFKDNFDTQNYENRTLADRPGLSMDTIMEYPRQYEAYFNDHIPFKNPLVSLYSYIDYLVFGESSCDNVILGKDGWLFYSTGTEGDPIISYEGRDIFSDKEVKAISESIKTVQDKLTEHEIGFALLIPPNKENVYSKYMPDRYVHAEISGTDRLISKMKGYGINVISPKKDYLEMLDQYEFYYRYDTHWNQIGAYIGVMDVLESWGKDIIDIEEHEIRKRPLSQGYHFAGESDLALMINLRKWVYKDEIEYYVEECIPMDWNRLDSRVTLYENETASTDKTCYLIGDSFRASMVPALQSYFAKVYVVASGSYDAGDIEKVTPDYVIAEYVERNAHKCDELSEILGFDR